MSHRIFVCTKMTDSSTNTASTSFSSLSTSLQFAIALLILNLLIFILILLFYIRTKYFRSLASSSLSSRSHRLIFAPHDPSLPPNALDPSILNSLPITTISDLVTAHECAVCLCELSDGERARFLPKCSHGFHLDCIDMWFQSNSTCPLCRNPVDQADLKNTSKTFSGGNNMLVIDIPTRTHISLLPGSPFPLSRMSPNSPLMTSRAEEEEGGGGASGSALGRMRSMRKISSSTGTTPRGCDFEEGEISITIKCQ